MKTYLIVFGMAILFHPFCSASADADFQNQPGWTWLVKPRSIDPPSWANSGVLGIVEQDRNSALIVTVTWRPTEGVEYRVIAFDVEGNRYLPEMRRLGVGSNGVQLTRFQFSLDLIRYEDVMHVGFEALRQEQRHVASQHAADRANQSGIEVLPFPQLNKSYPFTLTTVDGRSINQKEFSGKVVLFDCWAATCMPCMKDMPNILNTYNKWHASGLDIIGVNFDVEPAVGGERQTFDEIVETLEVTHRAVGPEADLEDSVLTRFD